MPTAILEPTQIPVLNLAIDTIKQKKQALVFVNTKRSAEKTAEEIAKKIKLTSADQLLYNQLAEKAITSVQQPTKQCERLALCLKKGIAFHHAGLTSPQKELIEDNFRAGTIKIIACTPTLAAGLDLPAFRAILKDVKRFTFRGMDYIPVLEYLQMAGRAGRPKYDKEGEAIIIVQSEGEKEKLEEKYIHGLPESISSKLAVEPVLRTYILSLIATGFVKDKKSILKFFEKTFWAHQFHDMFEIDRIVTKMITILTEWEFIENTKAQGTQNDFVDANEIDEESLVATPLGKRVAELYIDPFTARYLLDCLKRIPKGVVEPFAILQMISHTLEMRPLLNIRAKELEDIEEKLTFHSQSLLDKEPSVYDPEYDDFLKSIKTALFFHDWTQEQHEEYLLEHYNVRPGETRVKLDIANWLLYCLEEMTKIQKQKKLQTEFSKMRIRIKNGVKAELIPLLRFKGIGRVRARKLFGNKIKSIKDIKAIEITTLAQLVGKALANDLKTQVGQAPEKKEVKENKRKGQINLNDFNKT